MGRRPAKLAVGGDAQLKSKPVPKEKSDYQIQSVANALDLLEAVAASTDGLTSEGVRKKLRLSKEAIVKIAVTLERRGYLELDPLTDHYRLSLRTLELSQTFIRQAALFSQARPIIEELSRLCGETVYIAVMKQGYCVYLEQAETRHAVRVVSRFGSQLPAYSSAGGKVLLAGMTGEAVAAYLDDTEIVAYTPTTIVDRGAFEAHLRQVAAQGFAINEEELESGVCGVAAPIRDHTGRVIAAAVVSAPTVRVSSHRLHTELVPMIREAAGQISIRLGYNPDSREEG